MTILERLIADRKRRGLSQNDVAMYIGISKQMVSRLECGKSIPNIDYIEDYANYLGYELRLLMK